MLAVSKTIKGIGPIYDNLAIQISLHSIRLRTNSALSYPAQRGKELLLCRVELLPSCLGIGRGAKHNHTTAVAESTEKTATFRERIN